MSLGAAVQKSKSPDQNDICVFPRINWALASTGEIENTSRSRWNLNTKNTALRGDGWVQWIVALNNRGVDNVEIAIYIRLSPGLTLY